VKERFFFFFDKEYDKNNKMKIIKIFVLEIAGMIIIFIINQ